MTAVTPRRAETGYHAGRNTVDLADLVEVLTLLEDFLLHADQDVVDDLARYRPTRPDDPAGWACWVAGLLGEHAATLRDLTTDPLNGELS